MTAPGIARLERGFRHSIFSASIVLCIAPGLRFIFAAAASLYGQSALAEQERARNVILFIGDGMGVSTVTAARIFVGQQLGLAGEEHVLSFEHFENLALVKTYNSNQQVPDSAGAATAMHSGVKTRAGLIGLGPQVKRGDCSASHRSRPDSLLDLAEDRGLATGIVTNTTVTHATPATLYAHAAERNWESSADLPFTAMLIGCRDIARQLVDYDRGDGIDVVLGGGRAAFLSVDRGGNRSGFGIDLLAEWRQRGKRRVLGSAAELAALPAGEYQVMGLFADSHLSFVAERPRASLEPDLATMTARAIELLQQRGKGFFLMVEGGRIDHGHHVGKAGYALLETQAFDAAVARALSMVNLDDTLLVVTADHSATLTISGYPTRGNPILGLVVGNDAQGEPQAAPTLAADGLPYTTLGYQNGPGAVQGTRALPEAGIDAVQQALLPTRTDAHAGGAALPFGTHAGEDVALYAQGAGAALFNGVIDQQQVFYRIAEALGWRQGSVTGEVLPDVSNGSEGSAPEPGVGEKVSKSSSSGWSP